MSDPENSPNRAVSSLLKRLPWSTGIVLSFKDTAFLVDGLKALEPFGSRLLAYDDALFSGRGMTEQHSELQGLFGVSFDNNWTIRATDESNRSWNAPQAQRVCKAASAYRFLDVLCHHHKNAPIPSKQPLPRAIPCLASSPTLPGLDHLRDWPEMLLRFRSTLAKAESACEGDELSQASGTVKLVHHLLLNKATSDVSNVECNFIVAALHVTCYLKGVPQLGQPPDIPDNIDDLIRTLLSGPQYLQQAGNGPVSPPETSQTGLLLKRFIEDTRPKTKAKNHDNIGHLCSPLLIALWISPLCLLAPISFVRKIFHKQNLLTTSSSLGNMKPPALIDVEHVIWQALLLLVSGDRTPSSALSDIVKYLPWDVLEAMEDSAPIRRWFMPDDSSWSNLQPVTSASSPSVLNSAPTSSSTPWRLIGDHAVAEKLSILADPSDNVQQTVDSEHSAAALAQRASSIPGQDDTQMSPDNTPPMSRQPSQQPESPSNSVSEPPNVPATRSSSRLREAKEAAGEDSPPPDPLKIKIKIKAKLPRRKRAVLSDEVIEDEGGLSRENPIDVDAFVAAREPVGSRDYQLPKQDESLDLRVHVQRLSRPTPYTAYDAQGVAHQFWPSFHHGDYYPRLRSFFNRAQDGYVDRKPLHVADPASSVFAIIPYTEFSSMPQLHIQNLMRSKNVVVTGYPTHPCKFNKEALEQLHPLRGKISIQDYSFGPVGSDYSVPKTVSGTVRDILESAEQGVNGRILNGLEFPRWDASLASTSAFATDLIAWHRTKGSHTYALSSTYPVVDMNWGLAGTADTLTFVHIDSDGLNTGIQIMCGAKVWGILRERAGHPFSSAATLLHDSFLLDEVKEDSPYDVEAIVLKPGDLLFMQANRPHFVYGPDNTISHGFHYYITSSMRRTACGIINTFVLDSFLTNIAHHPTRMILRRILLFYYVGLFEKEIDPDEAAFDHLPDLKSLDGVLDLLALCNLVIMGNVLDFRTYSAPNQAVEAHATDAQVEMMVNYDQNDIPWDERLSICYARGIALRIVEKVVEGCRFISPNSKDCDLSHDLPWKHLACLLQTLVRFKKEAEDCDLNGAPHCSVELLQSQVNNLAAWNANLEEYYISSEEQINGQADLFDFHLPPNCTVRWEDDVAGDLGKDLDYLKLGTTSFDRKFMSKNAVEGRPVKRRRVQ